MFTAGLLIGLIVGGALAFLIFCIISCGTEYDDIEDDEEEDAWIQDRLSRICTGRSNDENS